MAFFLNKVGTTRIEVTKCMVGKKREVKARKKRPMIEQIALYGGILVVVLLGFFMLKVNGIIRIPDLSPDVAAIDSEYLNNQKLVPVLEKVEMLKGKIDSDDSISDFNKKPPIQLGGTSFNIVYLSFSDGNSRAFVEHGKGGSFNSAWANAVNAAAKKMLEEDYFPIWIKADVVSNVNEIKTVDLDDRLNPYYEHFYRKGLAFDESFEFSLIEAEINGNKVIDYDKDEIDLKRMNDYLMEYKGFQIDGVPDKLYEFTTQGYFIDEFNKVYGLYDDEMNIGRREIDLPVSREITKEIITTSTTFLMDNLLENGKYVYGYFPTYDMEIDNYNILRHIGTNWSLVIQYKITGDESILPKAELGIRYLIDDAVVYKDENTAYVVERKADEIKLGGNAVAIIMLTSYMEEFGTDEYKDLVIALGNGILELQDSQTGEYYHVLNYPGFTKKEEYRTVYYDGEATFALGKLYSMTEDPKWLEAARIAVDNFITKDYTQYRDHWVAYSVNEITKHLPEERFFEFGLRNAQENLERIYNQKTSYHTYLELLMVTFELYERIINEGHDVKYLEDFDIQRLVETINHRAFHMLNGYFYPEYAMYFKSPQTILGSFFVRHDAFRIRIDDVQHFIGGYYNYYLYFDKLQQYLD